MSQAQWQQSIARLRKLMGQPLSRRLVLATYDTNPPLERPGQYVVVEYISSFENVKSVKETVTPMMDTDGHWRITSYQIMPQDKYYAGAVRLNRQP